MAIGRTGGSILGELEIPETGIGPARSEKEKAGEERHGAHGAKDAAEPDQAQVSEHNYRNDPVLSGVKMLQTLVAYPPS